MSHNEKLFMSRNSDVFTITITLDDNFKLQTIHNINKKLFSLAVQGSGALLSSSLEEALYKFLKLMNQ